MFPGGGQFYANRVGSGVLTLLAFWFFLFNAVRMTSVSTPANPWPGVVSWGLTAIIWGANVYDARKETVRHNAALARQAVPVASTGPSAPGMTAEVGDDVPTRIAKLAELHKSGALTQEEFDTKKRELLARL